ncbi:MAG: FISUMP domain-containing protein [Candidatus Izemoplasmatales bacterium]|nr:FISUMP domain-containing protein [Candidatus Izemoplasmatales bacterium]
MLGFAIFTVNGASGVAAYYIDPGETYIATLDGRARKITNATSYTLFVPVRTLTEQQSFLNNLPAGVTALTNTCEWETTAILWGTGYPIVGIGNQCWMAKNLNYATGSSWCYDNNASNCTTYGRLYNWSTATSACPSGWHLPSDAEFTTLESTIGSARTAWMSTSGWHGLYGGRRNAYGSFYYLGAHGFWWSSTPVSSYAWFRNLNSSNAYVNRDTGGQDSGFSVRCLRN